MLDVADHEKFEIGEIALPGGRSAWEEETSR